MKTRILLVVATILTVGGRGAIAQTANGTAKPAGAVTLEVPDDLHQQLQQMRAASERIFREGAYNQFQVYAMFNVAADAAQRVLRPSVARRLSAAESVGPEAKLVTILADLKQRPEVYAEIESRYIRGVADPDSRFPRPPRLLSEHATETYRLAWEYVLLRPECVSSIDYGPMSIRALAVIHNPATLVTAVESFRIATQSPTLTLYSEKRQEQIIDLLRVFHDTPEGKAALEQCLRFADEQRARMTASGSHHPVVRTLDGKLDWSASEYAQSRGRQLPTEIPSP